VYVAAGEFSCQPGKALEFAKGIDASMAKFYRSQPGVHVYIAGVTDQDPNVVLLTMVASNKNLFDSLPKSAEDLEKLNAARGPFFGLLAGSPQEARRFGDSKFTVGNNIAEHLPKAVPDDADVGWNDIMGASSDPSFVAADESAETPKNSLFMAVVEYKTKDNKAEAVAKGLDATQGEYYRQFPDCLVYLHCVKDPNTAMSVMVWTSKEEFEVQPDNPALDEVRAPFRAMLDGAYKDAVRIRSSSQIVGENLLRDRK